MDRKSGESGIEEPHPVQRTGFPDRAKSSELRLEFDQTLQRFDEILKSFGRQHDRIPPAAHVFGDLEEASALVLFQIEEEDLPLNRKPFGSDRRAWR